VFKACDPVVAVSVPSDDPETNPPARRPRWLALLGAGAEFLGGSAGAAVGTLGGPAGVVGGAATGVAVTRALLRVGDEIEERVSGPAQRARMGGALLIAYEHIRQRIETGEEPRGDGFFEPRDDGQRPAADELLEGVLLRAGDSYEQKRVEYLGRLYASIAFRSEISPGYAHYLLRVADRLSYRQFLLLGLFANDDYRDVLRRLDRHLSEARGTTSIRPDPATLAELDQLGSDNLLGFRQNAHVAHFAAVIEGGTFAGAYAKAGPTPLGRALFEVLGLRAVPRSELAALHEELAPGAPISPPS
jgi:hypothetical protein